MPRKKEVFEAMREKTRKKIESAALSLFARRGLNVTVNDIAEAAGVSHGLLYSHYPSKDALAAELVRQAVEDSSQSIYKISLSEAPAKMKIWQTTALMCQMLSKPNIGIDYFMFMLQIGLSGFDLSSAPVNPDIPSPVESLSSIIVQGQSEETVVSGDPEKLSTLYWAAIQGLCCYVITGRPAQPEANALNRILLRGIM